MSDLFSIEGKVALVTGGSRGIGLRIARGLVDARAQTSIRSRQASRGGGGAQGVEGGNGIPCKRPIARMREVMEIMRLISGGERSEYNGRVYKLPLPGGEGKAIRSGMEPRPNIPVYLATLGPKSLASRSRTISPPRSPTSQSCASAILYLSSSPIIRR